jgi:Animal haem peroxidase
MDLATQSPTTEGRFGFMFKNQPPHPASGTVLEDLGLLMEEQPVISTVPPVATKDDNDRFNENPNPLLTSGFTFVGQFVDHDITFDTTPLSDQQADPNATTNFRTPRYDLDAIYGLGPNQNPQLYDPSDRDKFLLDKRPYSTIRSDTLKTPGVVYDVPRNAAGKATIADPRNDQTLIILQMHVAMQMFHNKLVDQMRALRVPRAAVFESARRLARWHYQWMVIHDFLPAIVGKAMADSVYKEVLTGVPIINIKYYKPTNPLGRPFIPVEFAVAAYRFGHSITRPRYTVQDYVTSANATVAVSSVPLFEAQPTDNNLNGSRPLPARLKIQWSKFFNADLNNPTARPVRQFDASLANPLFKLPSTVQPDPSSSSLLAQRNLLRGKKMGLPSGQQVARLMGVTPLTNAQLSQNHRIKVTVPIVGNVVNVEDEFDEENANLNTTLAKPEFADEAPLWFYILKEAEIVGEGRHLGPVGGRIVAEVLVGLLQKDPNSYLYLSAAWKPAPPIAPERGKFTMADLLKYAGVWS